MSTLWLRKKQSWLEQSFSFSQLEACICTSIRLLNGRISKIPSHCVCYAHITNFGKSLWKHWCDFIGQIFIDDISIHIEASIEKCSKLVHWIAWHSLTMIHLGRNWQTMFMNLIYLLKTKTLNFQFWWKLILIPVSGLKPWETSSQHKYKTTILQISFCRPLSFVKNFSTAAFRHRECLRFICLSYLIFHIPNKIQILVIISTYSVQSSLLESRWTKNEVFH